MTVIRVDPPALKQSAQNIQGLTDRINQVGHDLLGAANRAPETDSFQSRVQSISAEAKARASGLGGRFLDLGSMLVRKAYAFEAADQASIYGIRSAGAITPDKKEQSFWEKVKDWIVWPIDLIEKWLRLGWGNGIFSPFPILLFMPKSWGGLPGWIGKTFTGIMPPWKSPVPEEISSEPVSPPVPKKPDFQSPTKIDPKESPYLKFGAIYGSGQWAGDRHPGTDIKADKGEEVHPIADGKIVKIGNDESGYGKYIVIEHTLEDGTIVYSLYGHLDPDSVKDIQRGPVKQGSVIGKVGESGNWGNAHHVHLEVRTETGYKDWKYYSDAQKDDWNSYWLDPIEVIGNEKYKIQSI